MRVSTKSTVLAGILSNGAVGAAAAVAVAAAAAAADMATPHSLQMARSIMSRQQGIYTGANGVSEALQSGFVQKAFTALVSEYPGAGTADVRAYIRSSALSAAPFLSNATTDAFTFPLDRLSNGNAFMTLVDDGGHDSSSTASAATALRQSIDLNTRNEEGGLWYFVYPEWSYLDGMYSLAPFYTLWSLSENPANTTALDDMLLQLDLLWDHTLNTSSGLLVHGYDESRTAVWADPRTGASPHVWGRSLGWYSMALVDTLEILATHGNGTGVSACKYRKPLLSKFQALMSAVAKAVDPATGGWWQVMDQPRREGNYIESSGSAMFSYALLKGVRLGYLPASLAPTASSVATRAQKYLTETFVIRESNGTLGYNGTVSVCSLNSTASYEYYIGQPLLYNSVLGSAAYVLASVEAERL